MGKTKLNLLKYPFFISLWITYLKCPEYLFMASLVTDFSSCGFFLFLITSLFYHLENKYFYRFDEANVNRSQFCKMSSVLTAYKSADSLGYIFYNNNLL